MKVRITNHAVEQYIARYRPAFQMPEAVQRELHFLAKTAKRTTERAIGPTGGVIWRNGDIRFCMKIEGKFATVVTVFPPESQDGLLDPDADIRAAEAEYQSSLTPAEKELRARIIAARDASQVLSLFARGLNDEITPNEVRSAVRLLRRLGEPIPRHPKLEPYLREVGAA